MIAHVGEIVLDLEELGDVLGLLHHLQQALLLGAVGAEAGLDVVILARDVFGVGVAVGDVAERGETVHDGGEIAARDADAVIRAAIGGIPVRGRVVVVAADAARLDKAAVGGDQRVETFERFVKVGRLDRGAGGVDDLVHGDVAGGGSLGRRVGRLAGLGRGIGGEAAVGGLLGGHRHLRLHVESVGIGDGVFLPRCGDGIAALPLGGTAAAGAEREDHQNGKKQSGDLFHVVILLTLKCCLSFHSHRRNGRKKVPARGKRICFLCENMQILRPEEAGVF